MKKSIKVGTNALSYLEERNFSGLPYNEDITFHKLNDLYKIYNHLLFKIRGKVNPDYQYSFRDFGLNSSVDLFHFFSSIYFGKKPWFVTSSVPIPRWTKNHEMGISPLLRENCKGILLLSENCKKRQLSKLDELNLYDRRIEDKIQIIPPSQKTLIKSYNHKILNNEKIVFTLIGHQILIKGGLEVVRTFVRLQEKFPDRFEVHIVSLLHKSGFLDYDNSKEDIDEIKRTMSQHNFFIHTPQMDNQSVIDLLKRTHVSLLPSHGDSYGYSVLEAQACACPVISTNISALPESNNGDLGWMLEVPTINNGRADVYTTKERLRFSEFLEEQLYHTISQILETPSIIKVKGQASLEKIRLKHSPDDRANTIKNLYLGALN